MQTNWLKRHSSELIFGVCLTGMVGSTVLACYETPKALKSVQEAKEAKGAKLTPIDILKATWKNYAPPAAIAALSTAGMIFVLRQKNNRINALALACAASEKTIEVYKGKVKEVLGEKKAKEIESAVVKQKVESAPIPKNVDVNKTVIFEEWGKHYINATMDDVKNAAIRTYDEMMGHTDPDPDRFVTVNDFYRNLGIDTMNAADMYGWNSTDGISAEMFMPQFGSVLKDGSYPVISFTFGVPPRTSPEEEKRSIRVKYN